MSAPLLNTGQQQAADSFLEFLFSPEKEFNLRGAGGVGKTFLMGAMLKHIIPEYKKQCKLVGITPKYEEVFMTATTNKAAEALSQATGINASTIHNYLRLVVHNNYKTGKTEIKPRRDWVARRGVILFIDECSMIDSSLYYYLMKTMKEDCKIVYVGDHRQCQPVMERSSPIYLNPMPSVELTQNVRSAGQPLLWDLANQLRQTVSDGVFRDITSIPGIIDHFNDEEMSRDLDQRFKSQNMDDRILCFTNERVKDYNGYIRNLRKLPDEVNKGDELIVGTAFEAENLVLPVETQVSVSHVSESFEFQIPDTEDTLMCRTVSLNKKMPSGQSYHLAGAKIAEKDADRRALIKKYQKAKDWGPYFYMSSSFLDLRPHEAATVYKAQGSTYKTVIVDLQDIGSCHDPKQTAHMLYVALSRASDRIILFGHLPPKYGKVI